MYIHSLNRTVWITKLRKDITGPFLNNGSVHASAAKYIFIYSHYT